MTDEVRELPESVTNPNLSPTRKPLHPKYRTIQRDRARQESATDYLTGLRSRKYFQEELRRGFEIATRDPAGPGVGFLMIDIDNFKNFNEKYGHDEGDEVLKEVGTAITSSIRSVDIAGKEGGEEFGIMTPYGEMGAPLQPGENPAERVRTSIENMRNEEKEKVTVSVGTTDYYPDDTFEEFKKRSYLAKNVAKRLGRNRVVKAVKREEGIEYHDTQTNIFYTIEVNEKGEIVALHELPKAV